MKGHVGLSVIFLFLSIDEGFQIHENIGDIAENYIWFCGDCFYSGIFKIHPEAA